MERRNFREGDTIFREGDISDRAFQVVEGSVNVHLPGGRLRNLGPGEIFGEMGLLDARPRSATVSAGEDGVLNAFSEAELLAAIRTDPDAAITFIRALLKRLREANDSRRGGGTFLGLPLDNYSA
jgi:CRP/FNR family transcriptional regulator, cyclic AMP receptor protein